MRLHTVFFGSRAVKIFRRFFPAALILAIAFFSFQKSFAQCYESPDGDTAVGLQNSSSYFLTFYIDGENKGGVPAGDKSTAFSVTPGQHNLRAEAIINGEVSSASRTAEIPAGYVCTWTVTDPPPAQIAAEKSIFSSADNSFRSELSAAASSATAESKSAGLMKTSSAAAKTPEHLTRAQAIARVREVLQKNSAVCGLRARNFSARQTGNVWRVTATVKMAGKTKVSTWNVTADGGATPVNRLADKISRGCR